MDALFIKCDFWRTLCIYLYLSYCKNQTPLLENEVIAEESTYTTG